MHHRLKSKRHVIIFSSGRAFTKHQQEKLLLFLSAFLNQTSNNNPPMGGTILEWLFRGYLLVMVVVAFLNPAHPGSDVRVLGGGQPFPLKVTAAQTLTLIY